MNHTGTTVRRVGAVCASLNLAVILIGCGGTSQQASPVDTTVHGSGSTTELTPTTDEILPAAELTAITCTWRWFDRYEIQVAVPDTVPKGTEVGVQMSVIVGDVGSIGAGAALVTDGTRAQTVEARVQTPIPWIDPKDLSVYRNDALAPGSGALCDVSFDGKTSATFGGVKLQYSVDAPASDGTPFGDLITVDDHDARMFPLAQLMWVQPQAAFDRLYVAPDLPLNGIAVERKGTCRTVRTWYPTGSDRVTVEQSHGCLERVGEETQPGWTTVSVADNNWKLTVTGPGADLPAVVQALRWIDVPNGEEAEGGPTPGADAYIDGYQADNPGLVELGRFDFHDGKVAIFDRIGADGVSQLDRYLDPLVSAAGVNYGTEVVSCQEYTVGIASSVGGYPTSAEPGGYAYFIARDAGTTFTLPTLGLPPKVVPEPTASGVYLAFLDIGTSGLQVPQVSVTDANGTPVPCSQ